MELNKAVDECQFTENVYTINFRFFYWNLQLNDFNSFIDILIIRRKITFKNLFILGKKRKQM